MPSAHTAAAAAALRQQFGPGVAPMPTSKMMPRTGGPVAKGGAKGGKGYLTDGGSSGPQLTTDQQKVENLKRQVALLEADNRLLQQTHGGGATDGASVGVDPTIRQLRSDYARTESSFQARENELAAKVEELRKETLGAKLRERRAVDEMAEAKQLLSEQREKFAATRQELTSEVIAYQRDLDELLTSKRQLEVDLADAQQALQQREQFVSGYDEKMRLVESIKMQKEEECERSAPSPTPLPTPLPSPTPLASPLASPMPILRHDGTLAVAPRTTLPPLHCHHYHALARTDWWRRRRRCGWSSTRSACVARRIGRSTKGCARTNRRSSRCAPRMPPRPSAPPLS